MVRSPQGRCGAEEAKIPERDKNTLKALEWREVADVSDFWQEILEIQSS
jgi:hypothetical protein